MKAAYGGTLHTISGQYLTVDLKGTYLIQSFIVQCDNNDAYQLFYWNLDTSAWQLAWNSPARRLGAYHPPTVLPAGAH